MKSSHLLFILCFFLGYVLPAAASVRSPVGAAPTSQEKAKKSKPKPVAAPYHKTHIVPVAAPVKNNSNR